MKLLLNNMFLNVLLKMKITVIIVKIGWLFLIVFFQFSILFKIKNNFFLAFFSNFNRLSCFFVEIIRYKIDFFHQFNLRKKVFM